MKLVDELLMDVKPFFDNPKFPGNKGKKKPKYPTDKDGQRYCPICKNWKLFAEYHKQTSNHSSGHQRHCIACKKEQMIRVRHARG